MLTIYKTTEQGLEQIESMANGAWVKAIDPTPEEIEKLVNWGIDVDYINYSLDFDEMPRMERDEDYTFNWDVDHHGTSSQIQGTNIFRQVVEAFHDAITCHQEFISRARKEGGGIITDSNGDPLRPNPLPLHELVDPPNEPKFTDIT